MAHDVGCDPGVEHVQELGVFEQISTCPRAQESWTHVASILSSKQRRPELGKEGVERFEA